MSDSSLSSSSPSSTPSPSTSPQPERQWLSDEQVQSFFDTGLLVIRAKDIWTPEEHKTLLDSVNEMDKWSSQQPTHYTHTFLQFTHSRLIGIHPHPGPHPCHICDTATAASAPDAVDHCSRCAGPAPTSAPPAFAAANARYTPQTVIPHVTDEVVAVYFRRGWRCAATSTTRVAHHRRGIHCATTNHQLTPAERTLLQRMWLHYHLDDIDTAPARLRLRARPANYDLTRVKVVILVLYFCNRWQRRCCNCHELITLADLDKYDRLCEWHHLIGAASITPAPCTVHLQHIMMDASSHQTTSCVSVMPIGSGGPHLRDCSGVGSELAQLGIPSASLRLMTSLWPSGGVTDEVNLCLSLIHRPDQAGKWMKYYEKNTLSSDGSKILQRIENFTQYNKGMDQLLNGEKLLGMVSALFQERAVLYKEKINYKLPGGSGFAPHQDISAGWWMYGQTLHISALVTIDEAHEANGCLEVVYGKHKDGKLAPDWKEIPQEICDQLKWVPTPTLPGDVVFFDSYVPHRSAPNRTDKPRRVLYATYAKLSEGDYRDKYYADKRLSFPPGDDKETRRNETKQRHQQTTDNNQQTTEQEQMHHKGTPYTARIRERERQRS